MHGVASTSALVLLWTDESLYESVSAKKFFESINLDAGIPLKEELDGICDHMDEEVNNRKYGVKKIALSFLKKYPDAQVVFLGSGLDPRSLDLAESFPRSTVFDVDRDNMGVKEAITKEIEGPKNIVFCKADISNAQELVEVLNSNGRDKEKKTLVVAEGLTYYISKNALQEALASLRTPGGGLILEYAIPNDEIKGPRAPDCKAFFDKLQELLGLPEPLQRYSDRNIRQLVEALQGTPQSFLDQRALEEERTGSVTYYKEDTGFVHLCFVEFS